MKVLLVDDHTLVRKGIRALLLAHFPSWEIREAGNGIQAILACSGEPYDLIFLDNDMPKLDGLSAARQILKSAPSTRILMVSMHPEEELAHRLKEAGVMGFVHKNAEDNEFLQAVAQVRKGIPYFSNATPRKSEGPSGQESSQDEDQAPEGMEALTTREAEIFRMLTSGRSPSDIARDLSISLKTLDTHRTNIFRKCGVHSLPDLVRYAYRHRLI